MITWLLIEVTLGFVVFCADSVGDRPRRPPLERLVRAVLWMVTLTRWFTHRNLVKLGRFGAVVWFLVTTGWLLTLEYDRMATPAFVVIAELTMAFVVYCVDALSADLADRRGRRLIDDRRRQISSGDRRGPTGQRQRQKESGRQRRAHGRTIPEGRAWRD